MAAKSRPRPKPSKKTPRGHEEGRDGHHFRQADEFLKKRGIEYSHPDGVGQLLGRRKVKLKTGRPRHEKADKEEQEAFKKTSPIGCKAGREAARPPRTRQTAEGLGLR